MKTKIIRLGVAGALTALSLAAVAVPAHAAACSPVIDSVKVCAGEDGQPYPVQVNKIAVGPVPNIGGALMVGNTLTVYDGAWTPADAKLTHQWLRNDVPVLGAVGNTYRLTARDVGKGIRVTTTVTAPDYLTKTVKSAKTGPVTNVGGAVPMVTPSKEVRIVWAGDNEDEPSTLVGASTGIWPTPGIKFKYQWLRDGAPIPGATSVRFDTDTWDGASGYLSVRVTGYAPGFDPVTLTSAVRPVGGTYDPTPGAVITGRAALGEVLTADDSVPWSDPYGRGEPSMSPVHTYQWLRDGVAIPGATTLKYTITAEDLGKTLVLHTDTGTFSADSRPVFVPGREPVPVPVPVPAPVPVELKPLTNKTSPVLTGNAVTGNPMTVTAGGWSLPGEKLAYTYTWFSADGNVVGHGSSFTPGEDLVGKKLNVLVAATAPGYTTAWVRVIATKPVTAPDPTQTKAPAVAASPIVGQRMSVFGGVWSDRDSEVTRAFQWLRDGVKITGATGSAYTAAGADLGKTLSVTVTSALNGRILKTQTVFAKGKTAVGTITAGAPTITGKAVRGSVLTAQPGAWTKGAVLQYRWLRNGVPIANAYGRTYRVRTADKDSRLTVRVTGTLTGYTTAVRNSTAFIAR